MGRILTLILSKNRRPMQRIDQHTLARQKYAKKCTKIFAIFNSALRSVGWG